MDIILNLISPQLKKEFKIKQICQIINFFLITLFLVSIFIAMSLLFAEFTLQSFFTKEVNRKSFNLNSNYQSPNKKIKVINQNFKEIDNIQEGYISWVKILIYFTQALSSDIKIYEFKNINNSTEIKINAIVKDRKALLEFKESFKKDPVFVQTKFPFLNLTSKKNIDFQFEFKLDADQIKAIND